MGMNPGLRTPTSTSVERWAWAAVVANTVIILTGGLVRLTGSGLGCPTWPRCTDESWTNTPEMGLHGVIEFGNRLLTFLLVIIAVLTVLAVWRSRRRQRHPHPLPRTHKYPAAWATRTMRSLIPWKSASSLDWTCEVKTWSC